MFQLSEARKNLSELVNEAYYEGKLFGISKGKKPMGVLIGAKEWKEIVPEMTVKANKKGAEIDAAEQELILRYVITMRNASENK